MGKARPQGIGGTGGDRVNAGRELLSVTPSPDPRHDYLVTLSGAVGGAEGDGAIAGGRVSISMVPDRLVVVPDSLVDYLAALDGSETTEALALRVLDDMLNELVPRWIEVIVTRDTPLRHEVRVEDRQPDWVPVGRP